MNPKWLHTTVRCYKIFMKWDWQKGGKIIQYSRYCWEEREVLRYFSSGRYFEYKLMKISQIMEMQEGVRSEHEEHRVKIQLMSTKLFKQCLTTVSSFLFQCNTIFCGWSSFITLNPERCLNADACLCMLCYPCLHRFNFCEILPASFVFLSWTSPWKVGLRRGPLPGSSAFSRQMLIG